VIELLALSCGLLSLQFESFMQGIREFGAFALDRLLSQVNQRPERLLYAFCWLFSLVLSVRYMDPSSSRQIVFQHMSTEGCIPVSWQLG